MIRNNNPLNIRNGKTLWKGEVLPLPIEREVGRGSRGVRSSFCRFESVEWGLRAAFCLLRTYATKYKLTCVKDIINRWAPPSENDTTSYIRHVCQLTGFGGNQRLTEKDWPRLIKAMARVECGAKLEDDVVQKAFQLYKEGTPSNSPSMGRTINKKYN